ncbi:hypothetical protein DA798_10245 [Lactobacillus sp. PFC-70]|nr:hypothetical protein DA798_10245 [Lactobacillus sp. PFC-70]
MKKKLCIFLTMLITILLVYVGYTYMIGSSQDSVVRVKQVDANGTLINSPVVLVGKYKHNHGFNSAIQGYQLFNPGVLSGSFPRENKDITLKYGSDVSSSSTLKLIKHSRYLLGTGQQLNTTSVNGIQIKGKSNPQKRLRLFVSSDAVNWTKLTLDYPNVEMHNPAVFWNGHQLFIYDNKVILWTSDFKNWGRTSFRLGFNMKAYQMSVFYDRYHKPKLFIRTKSSETKSNQLLFYSSIVRKGGVVGKNWIGLNVHGATEKIDSVSYVHNKYVMFGSSKRNALQIYTSKYLSGFFKLKKQIKSTKFRYESPKIVKYGNKHLLIYTLADKHTGSSYGMRYREVSSNLSRIGKERFVNIPVTTQKISVVRIKE